MFYSQSEAGNGSTRGLETELARLTYILTRLDRNLLDPILEGQFHLVIFSGNAGDGKTAFIQQIEARARELGATLESTEGGRRFVWNDCIFETLYDGSVELSDQSNEAMLEAFLSPFHGSNGRGDAAPTGRFCLLLALNEGKLRHFFSHSTRTPWLSSQLLNHLLKDESLSDDIVCINLNRRAVVDLELDTSESLFDRVLDRYVAPEFWQACQTCACRSRCPVKFNVDTFAFIPLESLEGRRFAEAQRLNDQAKRARLRLKALLQVLHFRQRMHLTVRDLRSFLAFALFGKRSCAEIVQEGAKENPQFWDAYYYNALFDAQEKDRVIGLLRAFDIGSASTPRLDSQLSFAAPGGSEYHTLFASWDNEADTHRSRSRMDEDELRRVFEARPTAPEDRDPTRIEASRRYLAAARRKLFFEGQVAPDAESPRALLEELLPYSHWRAFAAFLRTGHDSHDDLKGALVQAISRSEGVFEEALGRENICVRTRHGDTREPSSQVKAFVTYPASDFALEVDACDADTTYIEWTPSALRLRHLNSGVSLDVPLDLYEMLMRIRDGYVPAAAEMRTFFLNLLMFKKQLLSLPSQRLLLAQDDRLYQLSRTPQNGLSLQNAGA